MTELGSPVPDEEIISYSPTGVPMVHNPDVEDMWPHRRRDQDPSHPVQGPNTPTTVPSPDQIDNSATQLSFAFRSVEANRFLSTEYKVIDVAGIYFGSKYLLTGGHKLAGNPIAPDTYAYRGWIDPEETLIVNPLSLHTSDGPDQSTHHGYQVVLKPNPDYPMIFSTIPTAEYIAAKKTRDNARAAQLKRENWAD